MSELARTIPCVATVAIPDQEIKRHSGSAAEMLDIVDAMLRQVRVSVLASLTKRWETEGKFDTIKQIVVIADDQEWGSFDELAASLKPQNQDSAEAVTA